MAACSAQALRNSVPQLCLSLVRVRRSRAAVARSLCRKALGQLSFVERVLNTLLANLTDPAALAKYRRLKLSALHKKEFS